jgi:transposase
MTKHRVRHLSLRPHMTRRRKPTAPVERKPFRTANFFSNLLGESVLRGWMRELTATPATAFPGNGQMRADLAEIAALKKEVARLRAERDILKKAAAFFAREAT